MEKMTRKVGHPPREVNMRWIKEKAEFEKLLPEAKICKHIDSGREATKLRRLVFDDAAICSSHLANVLQKLLQWSGDALAHFIVLEHEPALFFHRLFDKYPVFEVNFGGSPQAYLAFMNEMLGDNPANSISTLWWECVIVPPSRKWFIHALRSSENNGGHLWIPKGWTQNVIDAEPSFRRETTPWMDGTD
jgi:hypothetical protein